MAYINGKEIALFNVRCGPGGALPDVTIPKGTYRFNESLTPWWTDDGVNNYMSINFSTINTVAITQEQADQINSYVPAEYGTISAGTYVVTETFNEISADNRDKEGTMSLLVMSYTRTSVATSPHNDALIYFVGDGGDIHEDSYEEVYQGYEWISNRAVYYRDIILEEDQTLPWYQARWFNANTKRQYPPAEPEVPVEPPVEETLPAPTISLDGDILTITDNSGLAEGFDVLADGEVVTTVDVPLLTVTMYNYDGTRVLSTLKTRAGTYWTTTDTGISIMGDYDEIKTYTYSGSDGYDGISLHGGNNISREPVYTVVRKLTSDTFMYVHTYIKNKPSVSISGNVLTITTDELTVDKYRIYENDRLRSEIDRTGSVTTLNLTAIHNNTYGNAVITVYALSNESKGIYSDPISWFVEPPEHTKTLKLYLTNDTAYPMSYWLDDDPSRFGYVSTEGSIVGITNSVCVSSADNRSIVNQYTTAVNCSVEYYDGDGQVTTGGWSSYVRIYDIGDNASISLRVTATQGGSGGSN